MTLGTSGAILQALEQLLAGGSDAVVAFRQRVLELASDTDDNRAALAALGYGEASGAFGQKRVGLSVGSPAILVAEVLAEIEDVLDGQSLDRFPSLRAAELSAVLRLSVLVFALLETPVPLEPKPRV